MGLGYTMLTMEEAAKRELLEETGYKAGKMTKLTTLAENPTKSTSWAHVFLAEDLQQIGKQELDEDGEVELDVQIVTFAELWRMIMTGKIETMPMVATAMYALIYLGYIGQIKDVDGEDELC